MSDIRKEALNDRVSGIAKTPDPSDAPERQGSPTRDGKHSAGKPLGRTKAIGRSAVFAFAVPRIRDYGHIARTRNRTFFCPRIARTRS